MNGLTATPDVDDQAIDRARRDRYFAALQKHGATLVLLVTVLAATAAFDRFMTVGNVQNMFLQSSFLGLIAVGMTFVIISGGIDLSVGSLLALGGVLAALLVPSNVGLAVAVPIVTCAAVGALQGLLISRVNLAPFIVTLAGLLGIRGLALAIAGERSIGISDAPVFTWLGRGRIWTLPVPVVIVLVAFAVGGLVLYRTRFGTALFAIGDNEEAARLLGVDVDRVKILVYTISGGLAGCAGVLLAARLSAGQPVAGEAWELDAIAAVVVGGTLLTGGDGSMGGALVGVILLQVLQNIINQIGTLTSFAQQMVSGVFLIVVVSVQTYLSRRRTTV